MEQDTREIYSTKMFDRLKEHIGEEVIIQTRWTNGELSNELYGIMNEVKPFERIVVDNMTFPLYSLASMVYKVSLIQNNELLYINTAIIEQDKFWTHEQIEYMQREAFGNQFANQKREKRVLEEIKNNNDNKMSLTKAKEDLRELGLLFINKTDKKEWNRYLDESCNNIAEIELTKISLEIMRKLNQKISFDEIFYTIIEQKYKFDSMLDSGKILGIANIVSQFHNDGIEFLNYCKEVCNFERDVKFKPTVKM